MKITTKKLIIAIVLAIIVVIIALMAPPITSKSPSPVADKQNTNLPSPKPTPLLKIDKNSNLSEEIKKLDVPDYQSDYSKLDEALESF